MPEKTRVKFTIPIGAPRQSKEDIQSGVNEELKKLWIKEVFKTWRKQVLE